MDASITAASLRQSIQSSQPPLVIDVRRTERFKDSPYLLKGALRRDPEKVLEWQRALPRSASVVVYCVHGHEVSQNVAKALNARYLEGGIEHWREEGGETSAKPKGTATRWVTRERPKIDRIAPDVEFSHDGELCSFDAFLKQFHLKDPALDELARIVRGADTNRLELAPQAPGLLAISQGLSLNFSDDHEMLEQGMVIYDALYAWCRQRK